MFGTTLRLGPDARANQSLAHRVARAGGGRLGNRVALGHDLKFRADPALGVSGTWASPAGRLLELDATMAGPGDWCALHLSMPGSALPRPGLLGVAARGLAPEHQLLQVALRSGMAGGFTDTFFDKHVFLHPETTSHVDVLALDERPDIPTVAAWRELVIFLPTDGFRLTLLDMRVFAV